MSQQRGLQMRKDNGRAHMKSGGVASEGRGETGKLVKRTDSGEEWWRATVEKDGQRKEWGGEGRAQATERNGEHKGTFKRERMVLAAEESGCRAGRAELGT